MYFGFNFSQQWLLDPQEILVNRLKELQVNNLKEDEYYKLMIFFSNCKLE